MHTLRSRLLYVAVALVGIAVAGCGGKEEPKPTIRRIPLIGARAYPEGVAVHPGTKEIFVSSPFQGEIQRVVGDKVDVFFQASSSPELLEAFVGLVVDAPRNRLIACNAGGFQTSPRSNVVVIDTAKGTLLKVIPVPTVDGKPTLVNDVTVDANGNIYASDSSATLVWKVPADLSGISVLAPSSSFATPAPSQFGIIGLNGLAVAPSGDALIVTMTFDPHLYRVALPSGEVSEIQIEGGYPANGADGMQFANPTTLLILQNTGNSLLTVKLNPGYRTGRVLSATAPEPVQAVMSGPTTGEILDGYFYFANGQFSRQFTQDPVLPFELVGVPMSMLPLD